MAPKIIRLVGTREYFGAMRRAAPPEPRVIASALGSVADLSKPIEPLRYLCRGLSIAWAGKVVGVHGYSNSAKSPFLNLLALCVASGKPMLGHGVERVPVLYLDAETGPLAEIRLKRIAKGLEVDLGGLQRECWFRFVHVERPLAEILPMIEHEARELDNSNGIVLAFDSYSSLVGGDENKSEYADALWELGRLGRRIDAVPIAALHEKKPQGPGNGPQNALQGISGTNRLSAALATSIRLTSSEDNKCEVLVTCTRAPEMPFEPIRMTWTGAPPDEPLVAECEATHVATARDKRAAAEVRRDAKAREKVQRNADTIEVMLRGGRFNDPPNARDLRSACGLDGGSWGPAFKECMRRGTVRVEHWGKGIRIYAAATEPAGVGPFPHERPKPMTPMRGPMTTADMVARFKEVKADLAKAEE